MMKHYNSSILQYLNSYFVAAALLLVSCNDIVDYDEGYTPAELIANSGAPLISAVYDAADTELTTPITEGNVGQMVIITGENLNHLQSVKFNTVSCDMLNVYSCLTRAYVQIPSTLSMEQQNKIELTTDQGTTTFDFRVPFPPLTVTALACEFQNAGDSVTVVGSNFNLYGFDSGLSTVMLGTQTLGVGSITATSMKVAIPEGTPDNSQLTFTWQTDGTPYSQTLPFRPTDYLLFSDFSGVSINIDGQVQMAVESDEGIGAQAWLNQKNLHFTGTYGAWAWNTVDLSCNMVDAVGTVENDALDDYVLKMEVLTPTNFPLTDQTGLQFCFNWGDSYAWNPANGLGINTRGQWQTVSLPLAPMATKGIAAPGKWQTLRIVFQPHSNYEADFRLANMRIVKK